MKSKDLYPAIFSRHAAAYQRRLNQIMSRGDAGGRRRAIEFVDARPGMRVLDLACGPGTLTERLAPLVAPTGEVVGIDLAAGMIELARAASIPNARFEVMDLEQLSFPEGSFDAAVCGHGLQFASDVTGALREVHRILRPEARFAASVPVTARQGPGAVFDEVVDRWLPPAPQGVEQQATRALVADRAAFRRAAIEAGFAHADVELISENVRWDSAEQLVSVFTSWWNCAARLEGLSPDRRHTFAEEAVQALRRQYPGAIETTATNHVLLALA